MFANTTPEEEKKLVASLLSKLYISSGSSEDRLREAYTEVSCAVDDGILTDTTSRNALYKVHVSLGKIVNGLDEQQSQHQPSQLRAGSVRSGSVVTDRQPTEERSMISGTGERSIAEEADEEEQTTILRGSNTSKTSMEQDVSDDELTEL